MTARARWPRVVGLGAVLVAASLTIGATAGPRQAPGGASAERQDPRRLLPIEPSAAAVDGFVPLFTDLIRPGEPFSYPSPVIDDIVTNRRFVAATQRIFESLDGRLNIIVTVIDMGDPRVIGSVDPGEAQPSQGERFPIGALVDESGSTDEYVDAEVFWVRGPILVWLDAQVLSQNLTRAAVLDALAPMASSIDRQVPALSTVTPVRPATLGDEASAVGIAALSQLILLLSVRWVIVVARDPASRRRARSHFQRQLGRPPPPAEPHLSDVTKAATAWLWTNRLLGGVQLAAAFLIVMVVSTAVTLRDGGVPLKPERVVVLLVVVALAWFVIPRLGGVLCGLLSRGRFRPRVRNRAPGASRWLLSPLSGSIAVLGLLLSALLALLGFAVVLRSAQVRAVGVVGAVGGEETRSVATGLLLMGGLLLLLAAVPHVLSRRLAQRSARVSLGRDARPPVLLLRSFADDHLRIRAHRTARHHPLSRLRLTSRDRFEEVLAWSLWRSGPVTTVGQPGSRLPPLGATREYYADDDWQAGVSTLIDMAALVVVVVDRTESLRWEVGHLRARGALDRCIFVVPPVKFAERRARIRALEDTLGVGRMMSRLDLSCEVLVARISTEGEVRTWVSRFRDDVSYEVALEKAAESTARPLRPVVPEQRPRLERPAPRGARPKASGDRSNLMWGVVAGIWLFNGAFSMLTPGADLPEARVPDYAFDLSTVLDRVDGDVPGLAFLSTGRGNVAYTDTRSGESWEYDLGSDDRVLDFDLGEKVMAVSSLETTDVALVSRSDGDVLAHVEVGEGARSVLVSGDRLVVGRAAAGDVRVTDLRGEVIGVFDVAGVPLRLVEARPGLVGVVAAGTDVLQFIDLEDLSANSVVVGDGMRGLAAAAGTVYVLRPDDGELVAVDPSIPSVVARARYEGLVPGLSSFAPVIAADGDHVAVRMQGEGVQGLAVFDAETLRLNDEIWTHAVGTPINPVMLNGDVYTGVLEQPGLFGWEISP